MPSKTLLLSSLLGMMNFFQGTIALPASSTTSLIPESATTFGEPVQATPSTAVELATTSISTLSSLESDSNDSESHIVKRKGDRGWIQFYSNERCENPPISKKIEQQKHADDPCCKITKESAATGAASYIWIHWGTGDLKMTDLRWFNSTLECDYPTSFGGDFQNSGDSGHGICVKRPESIDSVIGVYNHNQ